MTKQTPASKITIAGFLLACGVLLPFLTAHSFGVPGTVFLPMHIPVLLCGFLCGPFYGAVCGGVLPVLNSTLTGMPVLFPTGIMMTAELFVYGLLSGLLYRTFKCPKNIAVVYICLILSMISGRIVSGIMAYILLLTGTGIGKYSVIGVTITGIPGIIVQLILIPAIVRTFTSKCRVETNAEKTAVDMIIKKTATCVIVKNNEVSDYTSSKGIGYVLNACKNGELKDAFVADKIVGKASAMLFSIGGVKKCYAHTLSQSAYEWLKDKKISVEYSELVSAIVNRSGDGVCPMEETVMSISDENNVIEALDNKLNELKKISGLS